MRMCPLSLGWTLISQNRDSGCARILCTTGRTMCMYSSCLFGKMKTSMVQMAAWSEEEVMKEEIGTAARCSGMEEGAVIVENGRGKGWCWCCCGEGGQTEQSSSRVVWGGNTYLCSTCEQLIILEVQLRIWKVEAWLKAGRIRVCRLSRIQDPVRILRHTRRLFPIGGAILPCSVILSKLICTPVQQGIADFLNPARTEPTAGC